MIETCLAAGSREAHTPDRLEPRPAVFWRLTRDTERIISHGLCPSNIPAVFEERKLSNTGADN